MRQIHSHIYSIFPVAAHTSGTLSTGAVEGVELLEKTPISMDDRTSVNGKEMEKAPLEEPEGEKGNEYSECPLPADSRSAGDNSKV